MYHELEKSQEEVHELARHLLTAKHQQKKTDDLGAKKHSYNVEDHVYIRDHTKKERIQPQVTSPLERPIYSQSMLKPRTV